MIMTLKNKKERLEFETKVVERHRKLEDRRNEREQKEVYDDMQISFVNDFESGEVVH